MKAQDLMLGDWVLYENEVWKVTQLSEGAIGIANKKRWWLAASVEGVPITPEILGKNGFKEILFDENGKESDNGYPSEIYRDETARSGYIIELGIYSPNFINIKWKEFGEDGWEIGELASFVKDDGSNYMVHELQHELKLCGINKEIIL